MLKAFADDKIGLNINEKKKNIYFGRGTKYCENMLVRSILLYLNFFKRLHFQGWDYAVKTYLKETYPTHLDV